VDKSSHRKDDHIDIALSDNVKSTADTGFDNYRLEHNALPELDFSVIDTSIKFLGRKLSLPLIISSITGGGRDSERINKALSEMANDFHIGFAVGSQRCAIDNNSLEKSFRIRTYAPNIPVLANIGASQLNYGYSIDECKKAVDMIDADALIFHLNPLHEVFQIHGTTNFSGLLKKIEKICAKLDVPVIVKEVGYGISSSVARKLANVGVYAVEVAGAGSISLSEIENKRSNDIVLHMVSESFVDWGNPTTECVRTISENVPEMKIIASGGVNTGVKIAKSIALGADLCGNASDFLKKIAESRVEFENFIESLSMELKIAMFCTGCKNIDDLKSAKIIDKRSFPTYSRI
jgi:isopentenyl-diphosphate delta-isomerase